jgi:phosphatidylglycerophosphate synthase
MSNLALIIQQKLITIPGYLPTALTLTRISLTPIISVLLLGASPLALPIYIVACATDLFDGKIARHLNRTSSKGVILDASADFLLIASGFAYYTSVGLASPLLLILMTSSFLLYVTTSKLPIRDRLGKHVGTILFMLLAALMLIPTIQVSIIVNLIGAAYVAASMIYRFICIRNYHDNRVRRENVKRSDKRLCTPLSPSK